MQRLFLIALGLTFALASGGRAADYQDERAKYPDSFKYYGPTGLWKSWNASQKLGRDTWIFWTGGNQKFLRLGTQLGGRSPVPVSIELFRMLDSRQRDQRFRMFGLINEPNCVGTDQPDEYGFYLDKCNPDPLNYYPTDPKYCQEYGYDARKQYDAYGESTGIVGLRKFKNPRFDPAKWPGKDKVAEYFKAPSKYEPPYLIGFSCAFCHIAFDPNNPPKDPEKPRWENLAANIGNQYFREGDLFTGRGRIVFGDRNPLPGAKSPYDTKGIDGKSLLYHYAVTQQPGTSETSRISYDFINNPNTINSIFYLGNRPLFPERTPDGKTRLVNHVLKDGADSVGVEMALLRVWVNIGCEGRYWMDTLFNPLTGESQRPLDLNELRLNARDDKDLTPAERKRKAELRQTYGDDVGLDWAEAHRRNPHLLGYLASYTPFHLKDAKDPGVTRFLPPKEAVERGAAVFAAECARCHSNKQPIYSLDRNPRERQQFYQASVKAPDFLVNNTLSDDVRYSVNELGTNMARALATNAVDGDVWAQLSSKDYKALPPLGTHELTYKFVRQPDGREVLEAVRPGEAGTMTVRFTPPGGGRGYYRTPSLVSMWATAPYLHNNALGDYCVVKRGNGKAMVPNDGSLIEDLIDTSVEGRMKMFQDGVEKLLWPEKRRYYIKKTLEDCRILELQPFVKQLLPVVASDLLFEILEDKADLLIEQLIAEKGLTKLEAELARVKLREFVRGGLTELRRSSTPEDLAALKKKLQEVINDKLTAQAAEVVPAGHVADFRAKLEGLKAKIAREADEILDFDSLKIPQGTPVNLYFNLPAGALPFALKAQIKHRNEPRVLAEKLLRLSHCPDLVEDRGHTYGEKLTEDQKRDLIEFLKTL